MFTAIIKNAFACANAVEMNRACLKGALLDTTTFSAITSYPVVVSDELCGGFACAYNERLHGINAIAISRGIYSAYLKGEHVDFIAAILKHEEGHIVCGHNAMSKFAFIYKMLTKGYDESMEYEADAYSHAHGYDMAYALGEMKTHYVALGYAHAVELFDARIARVQSL